MSSSVRFLETLAQDPAFARLSPAEQEAVMASFGVNKEERDALLAMDADALARLLGGRAQMWAQQFPGDDPQRDDEEPQREDDSPADDDDDASIRQQAGPLH